MIPASQLDLVIRIDDKAKQVRLLSFAQEPSVWSILGITTDSIIPGGHQQGGVGIGNASISEEGVVHKDPDLGRIFIQYIVSSDSAYDKALAWAMGIKRGVVAVVAYFTLSKGIRDV